MLFPIPPVSMTVEFLSPPLFIMSPLQTSTPWFGISMGLAGVIVGYVLANGVSSIPNAPAAQGNAVPTPSAQQEQQAPVPTLSVENIKAWAEEVGGLDAGDFASCMDQQTYKEKISQEQDAASKAGVNGTPGFWVFGPQGKTYKISGAYPYDTFKQVFDAMINGTDLPPPQEAGDTSEPPSKLEGMTLGQSDAPVTLVEYVDFECPFCHRFFSQTFGSIKGDYVDTGKVKMVYQPFPLPFHSGAMPAALAMECAGAQSEDAAWTMHDLMFQKQL